MSSSANLKKLQDILDEGDCVDLFSSSGSLPTKNRGTSMWIGSSSNIALDFNFG